MDYLDTAINTMHSAMESVQSTFQDLTAEWENTIADMKKKAREFLNVFETLKNKRAIAEKDPALKAEYDTLMDRGGFIKSTIEQILPNSAGMAGMGVIPLIPIAAILAAIAAISAWLAPAYVMLQKIELAEKALAAGQEIAPILEAGEGGFLNKLQGTTKELTKAGIVLGGGYLVWKFLPQIKKVFKQ